MPSPGRRSPLDEILADPRRHHHAASAPYEVFCECSDTAAWNRVVLTLHEYEHIWAEPTRFVEHVVESVPDPVVIERHGEAGKVAVRLEAESNSE
jgi:hypothetical protein